MIVLAFTLKNFINDSGFSNIRLLTCPEKIDSPIVGVNVIDNPDVTQWVKPGEIVLTTGYFFVNDLNLQTNVIMNLKTTGCSALCIKIKRFFPDVPENIIKTAEQAGLPVIDIPLEYTFSEITQKIHEQINNQQLTKIRQEQLLFNSLLNAFQSDHSLQNCLKLLSGFLSSPLFIVDSRLQCLFYYLRPEDQSLNSSADNYRIEPSSGQGLPLSPDGESRLSVKINSQERNAVLIPFQDQVHFLCIPSDNVSIPLDFVERAMKLFRFPEGRSSRMPLNVTDYYSDFFHFLLSSENNSTKAGQICEYYGYPHCKSQLCVLFSLRHGEGPHKLQEPLTFLKEVLHELSCRPSSYFLAAYKRQICLFFVSGEESSCQTAFQCVEAFQKKYHSTFVAGISQLVQGDRQMTSAYQQSLFLLSLANIFPAKDSFFFKDYILFWNIKELSPESKLKIYQDTVKPLVDYDKKNNTNLFDTLLQYFDARFNASLAAKQLYVHRNTFLKRMQKICELVPFDPDNINSLLSLYYGICIYLLERY